MVQPGAKWSVRLVARRGQYVGRSIEAGTLLGQARAALWLFCHFGGAGSKSRKGFGSFADIAGNRGDCCRAAAEFRRACGIPERALEEPESPSLDRMLDPVEVQTQWMDPWFALEEVGFAMQAFAQTHKHSAEKRALGLPRNIGQPVRGAFRPPKGDRHASPVHYHLAKGKDGKLIIRVVAFPAKYLPDLERSRKLLEELWRHLRNDLDRRAKLPETRPLASARRDGAPRRDSRSLPGQSSPAPGLPSYNEQVEAVLLEEKTKGGGWKAKHEASRLAGPIQNSGDVPPDKKAGDTVTLIVASCNEREIAFRWPTPADAERVSKPKPDRGPRGGRGGRGFPGRR